MDRFLIDRLEAWNEHPRRKPLLLNGARQVGKTWLIREFGRLHYGTDVAYVSFDNDRQIASQFDDGYDLPRILRAIQLQTGVEVVPGRTLLVFDEVQECPKALTSLKYFCEQMPELAVIAAGSLLGIAFHGGTGFPVGKVDMLDLYPLSFREFLDALGERGLREAVDASDWDLVAGFAPKLISLLKEYYVVGGMPEVVADYVADRDVRSSRILQGQIEFGYQRDMSKHVSARETERILAVWRSIPTHLGQENKKFVFGHIREGARARDYETAIGWLENAGLVTLVPRVSRPGIPLSAYVASRPQRAFKLFALDVGLLGALSHLDPSVILDGNEAFTQFKGAMTEQYVCQQLVGDCGLEPFYWSRDGSKAEIDFLVESRGEVYPIEVKAEANLRAKSLMAFHERFPNTHPMRFSLALPNDRGGIQDLPLFAIHNAWPR